MAPKRSVPAKKKPTVAKSKPPAKRVPASVRSSSSTLSSSNLKPKSKSINYDNATARQGLVSTYEKAHPLYFKEMKAPSTLFFTQAPEDRKAMANILKDIAKSLTAQTTGGIAALKKDYNNRTIKREIKYEKMAAEEQLKAKAQAARMVLAEERRVLGETRETSNKDTKALNPPKKKTKKESTKAEVVPTNAAPQRQHTNSTPPPPRPQFRIKSGEVAPNVYSHPSTEQNPEREEYKVAKALEYYVKKMFMASENVHEKCLRQVNSIDYLKQDFTKSPVDMKGLSLLMRLGGGPGFQQGAIDSRSEDGTYPRTVLSAESVVIMAKAMETFIQDLTIKMWMSKQVEPMSEKFDGYLDPALSDNHLIRTIRTVEYLDFLALSNYEFEDQWEEMQARKEERTKKKQEDYINTVLKMYENCDDKPEVVVNYMEFVKQRTSMEEKGADVSELIFDRDKTYPTADVEQDSEEEDSDDLPEPHAFCGCCKLDKEERKKRHMLMYRARMGISDDVADEDIDLSPGEQSQMDTNGSDSDEDMFWNDGMAMNFPPYGLGRAQTLDLTEYDEIENPCPTTMKERDAQLLKLLRRRIRAHRKDDIVIEGRKAADKAEKARKEFNAKYITEVKKKAEKERLRYVFGKRWKYEYKQFYKMDPEEEGEEEVDYCSDVDDDEESDEEEDSSSDGSEEGEEGSSSDNGEEEEEEEGSVSDSDVDDVDLQEALLASHNSV